MGEKRNFSVFLEKASHSAVPLEPSSRDSHYSGKHCKFLNMPERFSVGPLLDAKLVAMLSICLGSLVIGCAPIWLTKVFNRPLRKSANCFYDRLVSLLLCFGGGVLLFTTFLHLLPEIRETFADLEANRRIPPIRRIFGVQLSEIVVCCGFFFVYAVEEIVHFLLDRAHRVHSDGSDEDDEDEVGAIHRTMSMRRCQETTFIVDGNDANRSPKCVSISLDFHNVLVNGSKLDDDSLPADCPHHIGQDGSLFDHPVDNTALYNRTSPIDDGRLILTGHRSLQGPHGQSTSSLITNTTAIADNVSSSRHCSHKPITTVDPNDVRGMMRGLVAVLALSVHAIFEGLAVGLEESPTNVWYMFLAIASHKFVVVFCVGMELASASVCTTYICIYITAFSVVTPIGVAAGIFLISTADPMDAFDMTAAVLQAMAAGTLLYVIFFEVLARDRSHPHQQSRKQQQQQRNRHDHPDDSGFYRLFAIICGFLMMFVLHLITHSECDANER